MPNVTCLTTINGFRQDAAGDWIADLACGHSQHVRHQPPWQVRPWVQTQAGRDAKTGAMFECPLCCMPVLPSDVHEYKRTSQFSEATIPAGLLRDHRTMPGVWARIVVASGQLQYLLGPCTFIITPSGAGIIPPAVSHQVKALGPVGFHIEFLRQNTTAG